MYLSGLLLTPAAVLALLISWAPYGPRQDDDVRVRENVRVRDHGVPAANVQPAVTVPPVTVRQHPDGEHYMIYGAQTGATAPFVYAPSREQASPGVQAYKKAETSEQKAEARELIRRELEEQYDKFMEDREKEIIQLEERIAKLREQLARRRDAKSRMVELKLEMVISQADGLGWPEPGGNDHRVFGFGGASAALDAVRFYESFQYQPRQGSPPSIPVRDQEPPVAPTIPAVGGGSGTSDARPR